MGKVEALARRRDGLADCHAISRSPLPAAQEAARFTMAGAGREIHPRRRESCEGHHGAEERGAMQPAQPAAVQVWMKRRVDDGVTTTDRAKERADELRW